MTRDKKEEYLEAILHLSDFSDRITSRDVAVRLGITQPSVVAMFKRLDDGNLVSYTKYSGVKLLRKGRNIAYAARLRREVFSRLFESLGLDPSTAEKCSCCISCDIPPDCIMRVDEFTDFLKENNIDTRWRELVERKG